MSDTPKGADDVSKLKIGLPGLRCQQFITLLTDCHASRLFDGSKLNGTRIQRHSNAKRTIEVLVQPTLK